MTKPKAPKRKSLSYEAQFSRRLDACLAEFRERDTKFDTDLSNVIKELLQYVAATHRLLTVRCVKQDEQMSRMANLMTQLVEKVDAVTRKSGPSAQDAWNVVNALIKHGELRGNGCDETAERNGLILATNTIFNLMNPEAYPWNARKSL